LTTVICALAASVANKGHAVVLLKQHWRFNSLLAFPILKEKSTISLCLNGASAYIQVSVIAGIEGFKKIAYEIWGDTVNIASRMESGCEPEKNKSFRINSCAHQR
jgi:hypothetical protein